MDLRKVYVGVVVFVTDLTSFIHESLKKDSFVFGFFVITIKIFIVIIIVDSK